MIRYEIEISAKKNLIKLEIKQVLSIYIYIFEFIYVSFFQNQAENKKSDLKVNIKVKQQQSILI